MAISTRISFVTLLVATLILQLPLSVYAQWACSATYASGLTPASEVTCPAAQPNGCGIISEPDYCCPVGTYCKLDTNNNVGCCLYADSCYGEIVGGGGYYTSSYHQSTWYPTSTYYQPTTVYATQPATTVVAGAPVVVTQPAGTTYVQNPTTTAAGVYNGYCSTLRENGVNQPTTAAGQCGTILIVAAAGRTEISVIPWVIVLAALYTIAIL